MAEDMVVNAPPMGWAFAAISELIGTGGIFADGDWVESKDQDPSGDVRLIQLADIGDGVYLDKSSRFLTAERSRQLKCTYLAQGDVLIARMPDPLGRSCIYPGDPKTSVTAVDVCIVRTGAIGPNHRWLSWFINSPEFRDNVASFQSGSTRKRISRKNLGTIPLPVPPLAEQHRIVAEIETQFTRLDASVAALRRAQANLKRYRASVLKDACEGRLVPTEAELARSEGREYEPADVLLERVLAERHAHWESQEKRRGKYKEPSVPDTSTLPELPEGWVWIALGQCFDVYVGATPRRNREDYWNGEIAWVSSGEISFNRITETRETITTEGLKNSSTDLHPPGTVLLGMIGEGKTRGQVSILDIYACNSQNSAAIRVSEAGASPEFVYYYLWGQYRETRQIGSGNNQPALKKSRVQEIFLPLPPLAEQHRIVAEVERRLSVVQQAEATVEASLARAERLRQSILKQAFSGKLVPQDPDEEPASVLLERIRAEREAEAQASAAAKGKSGWRGKRMATA